MTKISGISGMTTAQINAELDKGAKFVVYQYCISIVVMTFKRSTDIHFIKAGESGVAPGIVWSILTFVFGWWGIPWGPIYTIGALYRNFSGGKDVTAEVLMLANQNNDQF